MALAINAARGEAAAVLAGEPVRVCLTLGALAEVESVLGPPANGALGDRLARIRAADVGAVLEALLRGGGHDAAAATKLAGLATPDEAARAIVAAFEAAAPQ